MKIERDRPQRFEDLTRRFQRLAPVPIGRQWEWYVLSEKSRDYPWFSDLPGLYQPRLLLRNPLQQFSRRLVVWVLIDQLAAHGQIENETA